MPHKTPKAYEKIIFFGRCMHALPHMTDTCQANQAGPIQFTPKSARRSDQNIVHLHRSEWTNSDQLTRDPSWPNLSAWVKNKGFKPTHPSISATCCAISQGQFSCHVEQGMVFLPCQPPCNCREVYATSTLGKIYWPTTITCNIIIKGQIGYRSVSSGS